MSGETWRVVLATGETEEVTVTQDGDGWVAQCEGDPPAWDATRRDAVMRLALMVLSWPVREILAPGEPTRAEITAERDELAASLTAERDELRSALLDDTARMKRRRDDLVLRAKADADAAERECAGLRAALGEARAENERLREAIEAARREGAEAAREACAARCDAVRDRQGTPRGRAAEYLRGRRRGAVFCAEAIRSLPLPGDGEVVP